MVIVSEPRTLNPRAAVARSTSARENRQEPDLARRTLPWSAL